MTIKEFIAANGITATSKQTSGRDRDPDQWSKDASHWRVELNRADSRNFPGINIPYSMGSAYGPQPVGPPIGGYQRMSKQQFPGVEDVLGCIQSDCQSIENARDFADWAADFGYDADSRKAEKIYRTCQDQAQLVRSWLGRDLYRVFLDCTEE
jgi:hypothetical protein